MRHIFAVAFAAIFAATPFALRADTVGATPDAQPPGQVAPAPVPPLPTAAEATPAAVTPALAPVPAPVPQPAPVTVPRPPVPTVSPDFDVFRRTPTIDGTVDAGEWDKFYSFDYSDVHATTYIDWDDNYLYVASKTNAPTDLLVILDGAGDGWFHGSDNFEITAKRARGTAGPTLTVSRYQSQGAPGVAGTPLVATESSAFVMKAGTALPYYTYEICIPRSAVPGLELKSGEKFGIKVAVGVGTQEVVWIPSSPLGDVQTATLVTSKSSLSFAGKVDVTIRDTRIVPGEDLIAKISVRNASQVPLRVDSIVVGGEGRTSKLLGSQLIRLDGVEPQKSFTRGFRSQLSRAATPGSAALGVEVRSGDDRVGSALVSFDIVPAYSVRMELPDRSASRNERRVIVIVHNNTQGEAYGRVKLNLPEGWTVRHGGVTKTFLVRNEEGEESVIFRVTPPEKADQPAPVLAEVQIGQQTLSVSGVLAPK